MRYTIEGGSLPVAICELQPGEVLISEAGGRTWMTGDIETEASTEGGLGKGIGRMLSGESLFLSRYTARAQGQIAFASSFPGSIIPYELKAGESIIAQKRAFMAATYGVNISLYLQKKIGSGFFGGEGFIMQKITGPGIVFLEIDGYSKEYTLGYGEQIVCDTGVAAFMQETCSLDIRTVKGLKNVLFGGEGLFDTVITGPGKVWLQTMPISSLAGRISPYIAAHK